MGIIVINRSMKQLTPLATSFFLLCTFALPGFSWAADGSISFNAAENMKKVAYVAGSIQAATPVKKVSAPEVESDTTAKPSSLYEPIRIAAVDASSRESFQLPLKGSISRDVHLDRIFANTAVPIDLKVLTAEVLKRNLDIKISNKT